MRGQVIPGNRVEVTEPRYVTPAWEISRVLSLQALQLAAMFQRSGLRYGYGAGEFGAEGIYEHGPMAPMQFFTGAEAFRLATAREAERRDYTGELIAAPLRPFGAMM
jgi:hypothetical protein